MSVLNNFGNNLQLLCEQGDGVATTARELGVSRVQFYRYLTGQSYPKPHILMKICDYFGVNARIYTEELTGADIELMRIFKFSDNRSESSSAMFEAVNQLNLDKSLFTVDPNLPDGLYCFYRWSATYKGKIALTLMSIKTLKYSRIIRGFENMRIGISQGYRLPKVELEYRGIILRQISGFSCVLIHSPPLNVVTCYHFTPTALLQKHSFEGIAFLGRSEHPEIPRLSRAYIRRIDEATESILALARKRPVVDANQVPDQVLKYLNRPLA